MDKKTMKAMVVACGEDGGVLEWREIPIPEPGPYDLLVRVKAAGVNRADILQLQGSYPPASTSQPVVVAGLEAAGEVVKTGPAVSGIKAGDRVMGLCQGGYAQFTLMDARLAIPVPERLAWTTAAAFALGYMTEHNALCTNGNMKAGDSVLISAASSGVGVVGVQLAQFFGASRVIATTGSPQKFSALKAIGVDVVIDYRNENVAESVLKATGDRGVDIILDHVGGPDLGDNLRAMAVKGRLISIGRLGGGIGELDMELLALKRLRLIGVTFRTRTLEDKIAIVRGVIQTLVPALADGLVNPAVDRVFPLEKAPEAHMYMRSSRQFGKIVLSVEGDSEPV